MRGLPVSVKRRLKPWYIKGRKRLIEAFRSYGPEDLAAALRSLGVRRGDVLMMHSSLNQFNGFTGTPSAVIDTVCETLGSEGTLLMVSMPYRTSTLEYLRQCPVFDVRKTPSVMGLITEVFRRRAGVLRSAHPTHPMLAVGARAAEIIDGHEHCLYPCGPGTPYEKVGAMGGKVLFFDVPFHTFTFVHYLEHLVSDSVGFPIYTDDTFEVPVVNTAGEQITVRTKAFSTETITRRRVPILEAELNHRRLIHHTRAGNTRLMLVELPKVLETVHDMTRRQVFFHDRSGLLNGGIR